jgi:hypothetical protein
MLRIFLHALRGAFGFGLGGCIVLATILPLGHSEKPARRAGFDGRWQCVQGPVDFADFDAGGTVSLILKTEKIQRGTFTVINADTAALQGTAPWSVAHLLNDGQLEISDGDGNAARFLWVRNFGTHPRNSMDITTLLFLLAVFTCGALGAGITSHGLPNSMRAVIGFGIGFVLSAFIVVFVHISLQGGGPPDYTWGAIGCGLGLGIGGAIGGFCLRPLLGLAGAISFGLAGIIWGPLSFAMVSDTNALIGGAVILLPFVLGGTLFGSAVGLLDAD